MVSILFHSQSLQSWTFCPLYQLVQLKKTTHMSLQHGQFWKSFFVVSEKKNLKAHDAAILPDSPHQNGRITAKKAFRNFVSRTTKITSLKISHILDGLHGCTYGTCRFYFRHINWYEGQKVKDFDRGQIYSYVESVIEILLEPHFVVWSHACRIFSHWAIDWYQSASFSLFSHVHFLICWPQACQRVAIIHVGRVTAYLA